MATRTHYVGSTTDTLTREYGKFVVRDSAGITRLTTPDEAKVIAYFEEAGRDYGNQVGRVRLACVATGRELSYLEWVRYESDLRKEPKEFEMDDSWRIMISDLAGGR